MKFRYTILLIFLFAVKVHAAHPDSIGTGSLQSDQINPNDAIELLDLVLTEKDYRDAVGLLERTENAEVLIHNQDIRQKVANLAELYLQSTPEWAADVAPPDDKTIVSKNGVKDTQIETYGGGSGYGLNTGAREEAEKESMVTKILKKGSDMITKREDVHKPYSLLGFMLLAFMAGLLALLTPCVFPMIPMTVTFFTTDSGGKRKGAVKIAIFYGLSIIFIYTFLGIIVAMLFGPAAANFLSTHWLPNVLFFLVFVLFGLSFLGMFEITLPNWLINKADAQADKGGIYGAFFLAFTLVLVSFSCTGPIVGAILVESAGGQLLKPTLGMFSFSLAFAIPFSLFAIFPSWLRSLPKSGGWLNSVKVVLGFLELALALKFLSIADQVYHWGILDREVYLAFGIVIFTLMGFYILGKVRLPNDSEVKIISVPRLVLSLITFSFVVYLIPGMFGAPLKALSGYLPPITSHDFELPEIIRQNAAAYSGQSDAGDICDKPKHSDDLHLPHGLKGYFDFQQGLACAKKLKKPVFIDFTGHGCVNCREMESNVWAKPEVLKRLKNDYVIIALYVDDKKELDESLWYTSDKIHFAAKYNLPKVIESPNYDDKVKKTIGKQNANLQIIMFNNNAQPYYLLLDHNGTKLAEPKTYDKDWKNFVKFLDEGLKVFENNHQLSSL